MTEQRTARRGNKRSPKRQVGSRQQFWHWTRAQYEPFIRRLHKALYEPATESLPTTWLSPGTLRPALIPVPDVIIHAQQSADQITEHYRSTWAWVIKQPAFRVLKDDPNFTRAWRTFQGRRRLPSWNAPNDAHAACGFVYLIVIWLGVTSVPGISAALNHRDAKGAPVRTDKVRARVRKDLERIEGHIAGGVISFDSRSDIERLTQLLAKAKMNLARQRPKGPGQKDLDALACFTVTLLGPVNCAQYT